MSGKRVNITPNAQAQLAGISDFIAQNSYPEYARKVIGEIREAIRQLSTFPKAGQKRDDLLPEVRQQIAGRYVIFYRELEGRIDVLHVVHGARDLKAFFQE